MYKTSWSGTVPVELVASLIFSLYHKVKEIERWGGTQSRFNNLVMEDMEMVGNRRGVRG